jgi:hypothetical protein
MHFFFFKKHASSSRASILTLQKNWFGPRRSVSQLSNEGLKVILGHFHQCVISHSYSLCLIKISLLKLN